jgi:hypothetical protein
VSSVEAEGVLWYAVEGKSLFIHKAVTRREPAEKSRTARMAKPTGAIVIIWRDLAQEGYTYAEIARKFPDFTVNQIRHYCLGNTGAKLPGPIQKSGRWQGRNVWLQGEKSPHAGMKKEDALLVLEDWDSDRNRWKHSAAYWAKELEVSPSAIQQLRRGDTWKHLNHPNQRSNREARGD